MKDLDRLRSLLGLDEDRESVVQLDQRVSEAESRTDDVAEVLPAAMDKALAEGRLAESLSKPVEKSLHESISRDPQHFADILFPIMGPAIRKSIAEAMKSLVEGLNQTVRQSPLSPNWWKWRMEAARSGLSFREVVLRNTLAYRISQVFLIQRDSGLLMAHANDELEPGGLDEDAVSAMLSAIQDFIRDSVGDEEAGLSSAELGAHTVWTLAGPEGQLAAVVAGHPPTSLRATLREKLEQMHGLHHSWMADYDGSAETPADLQQLVDECLLKAQKDATASDEEAQGGRVKRWLWGIGLVALTLLAWWGWSSFRDWQERSALSQLKQRFDSAPGLVLIETERGGDNIVVRALADPVADDPATLLDGIELRRPLRFDIDPYQSMDREIVARRLAAVIEPPAGVSIAVGEDAIAISGNAEQQWIERVRDYAAAQAGPTRFDLSGLRETAASQLSRLAAALQPPPQVQLAHRNGRIEASGQAPLAWVEQAVAAAPGLVAMPFDASGVIPQETDRLQALQQRLQQRRFLFADGTTLLAASRAEVPAAANEINELTGLAEALDQQVLISLLGYTDSVGGVETNARLRRDRSQLIGQALVAAGVDRRLLRAVAGRGGPTEDRPDLQWRRVDIVVELTDKEA